MYKGQKIVAIIPALNEEKAIGVVVKPLVELMYEGQPVIEKVIVCDNGSTDKTAEAAIKAGATVVSQPIKGYGIACLTAMSELPECDIVLFLDGDDACFVEQSLLLLDGVINGDDLAIGSRTLGHIAKGALTPTQMLGNWIVSHFVTFLWRQKITDLGPFRAMKMGSLESVNMQDKTFGWTIEMQVKAIICGMQVTEYKVDSKVRIGQSKISGTVSGSIKAALGITNMMFKLFFNRTKIINQHKKISYE